MEEARSFCRRFFRWYNEEHHHEGLSYLTPFQVHSGQALSLLEDRQRTMEAAYQAHPERFSHPPMVRPLPSEVWINRPTVEINLSSITSVGG